MGILEEKNKKIIRRTKLQEAILVYVASGGRRGSGNVIPEVLGYLLGYDTALPSRKLETVKSTASRLVKKGLMRFGNNRYELTHTGKRVLSEWEKSNYKINRPKRWDGKWRMVIFDIPEKKRAARDEIRRIFVEAGFVKLQDSVWIYPFDCEDVVGLLKTRFEVGKNILYIIADQIENDKHLRMEFDLLHTGD